MRRSQLVIVGAAGLALAVLLGCPDQDRRVEYYVELDTMQGTSAPEDQIVDGAPLGLEDIYRDEQGPNKDLTVDIDQTDLTLGTNIGITYAELDNLEAAQRSTSVEPTSCGAYCTRYHIYGVVVDHIFISKEGLMNHNVLGNMWTDDCRGFALFYRNSTIQDDPARYLRAAAHEIGHTFNLHHADRDGSTLMAQSKDLDDSWTYAFSSESLEHLTDHPVECSTPGLAVWNHTATEHPHGSPSDVCP